MEKFVTDYISNPKSDKWNSPDYPYDVSYVRVKNKISANSQNVFKGFMQCRSIEQATTIIEYWNRHDDSGTYILVSAKKRE